MGRPEVEDGVDDQSFKLGREREQLVEHLIGWTLGLAQVFDQF
nr:hypothetical protein [Austwickia chelonae]